MSLKLINLRDPNTTWIQHQKVVLTRISTLYLTYLIQWLQMSEFLQGIYRFFQELVLIPLNEKFYPVKPLLPIAVQQIQGDTLHDLEQYIAREVTPLSQSINLKLRQAEVLAPSNARAKKGIYEEALALYHQMHPRIQVAGQWMSEHAELNSGRIFIELKTELRQATQLVNRIATLNPNALFLRHHTQCPTIPAPKPIGLINENRNDCFMNAIRQLLFNIRVLRENVISKLPNERYASMLSNAVYYMLRQQRGETTPIGGSSAARDDVDMQTGRQEDATEALAQVLNDITDLERINPHLPISPHNVQPHNPLLFWTTNRKRFEVLGNYADVDPASKLRINQEGWLQSQHTINSSVILDLKGVDNISLETAIQQWANSHSGGDTYRVTLTDGRSTELPLREEQNRFLDLPPYLILTLKRFERERGRNIKESRVVDMHETFILDGNIVHTGRNGRYRIKGFVSHKGDSADGGHYVSYVFVPNTQGSDTGIWYLCDDRNVTEVDIAQVRNALSECYFVYSELEEEISPEKAKVLLEMRQRQTTALELQLAMKASMELALSDTPEKRMQSAQNDLGMLQIFKQAAASKDAEADFLGALFIDLPKDFQAYCLKILQLEKGYSESEAFNHLGELKDIATSYLIREPADEVIRTIIDQYIYMKEQYLLLMQHSEDIRRTSEFQLRQLLALQSILESKDVTSGHVRLALTYLNSEVQKEIVPFLDSFKKAHIQRKVTELLEATQKLLLD